MFGLTPKQGMIAISLPLLLIPLLGARHEGERIKISGMFRLAYVQQHAGPVGDVDGHVVMLTQAKGSNRNTGRTDYMDGAEAISVETADLIQGNGPHQGYITFSKNGETTVTKWNGKVTTVMRENVPMTSFEGSWTLATGTGQYQGVTGSGTYQGRMISPTEFTVDWKGEYSK